MKFKENSELENQVSIASFKYNKLYIKFSEVLK